MELEHFSKKGLFYYVSDEVFKIYIQFLIQQYHIKSFWYLIIFRSEVNSKNAQNHQKVILKRFQFNEKLYIFFHPKVYSFFNIMFVCWTFQQICTNFAEVRG